MSSVALQVDENIALLTINNPSKLNCLNTQMLDQLNDHVESVERDPSIGVLILTGEGSRAFCTGADINSWGDLEPAEFARFWVRDGHRIFDRIARLSIPTIAALNGHTMGGGLELAAACDIRLMTPKGRIALPEASIGIVPGWSGTQRLARLLPEPVLKEMALFGVQISADRAHQIGFVGKVVEDVLSEAKSYAKHAMSLSPRAIEINKRMIHAAQNEDAAAMVEALGSAAIAASEDRREGVKAFREKRKPNFHRNTR